MGHHFPGLSKWPIISQKQDNGEKGQKAWLKVTTLPRSVRKSRNRAQFLILTEEIDIDNLLCGGGGGFAIEGGYFLQILIIFAIFLSQVGLCNHFWPFLVIFTVYVTHWSISKIFDNFVGEVSAVAKVGKKKSKKLSRHSRQ